jgi:hypothetical protein
VRPAGAVLLLLWAGAGDGRAAELSAPAGAAKHSTNPFAFVNTLQIEPRYIHIEAGGNATQLEVRLALVYSGLWIPGLRVGNVYSVARLEMFGESLNTPAVGNVTGLQNWQALLLGIKPFAWGALVALGVDAMLPTSTNAALDTQEFQVGPAFGAYLTRVPKLQIGVLVQFYFSAGGPSPGITNTTVQPFVSYHLPKAFFFKTDGIMTFDFVSSPHSTVPVNLHVGRGITAHVVISAIAEVVTTGSGVGNVMLEANLNYLGW